MKKSVFSIIGWATATFVVGVAILQQISQPNLDWEGDILPLAQKYAGVSETETSPLRGKVVVITGATSGIGFSLAKAMDRMGAKVVAIGRSSSKLARLKSHMASVACIHADLADLGEVNRAATEISSYYDHVDILINNAGMVPWNTFSSTEQDYDMTFGVNYMSHFLLTEKLAPVMRRSEKPTIVQISSGAHHFADASDLVEVGNQPPLASQPGGSPALQLFRPQRAYANSKLAQILHARAFKRMHRDWNVRFVSACPSWVATHLAGPLGSAIVQRFGFSSDGWGLASIFHAMLEEGEADYYVNDLVSASFEGFGKNFLSPNPWTSAIGFRDLSGIVAGFLTMATQKLVPSARPARSSTESYDLKLQNDLYRWSYDEVSEWFHEPNSRTRA